MDTLTMADLLRTLLETLFAAPLVFLLLILLLMALFRPARRPIPTVVYVTPEHYDQYDSGSGCLPLLLILGVPLLLILLAI